MHRFSSIQLGIFIKLYCSSSIQFTFKSKYFGFAEVVVFSLKCSYIENVFYTSHFVNEIDFFSFPAYIYRLCTSRKNGKSFLFV